MPDGLHLTGKGAAALGCEFVRVVDESRALAVVTLYFSRVQSSQEEATFAANCPREKPLNTSLLSKELVEHLGCIRSNRCMEQGRRRSGEVSTKAGVTITKNHHRLPGNQSSGKLRSIIAKYVRKMIKRDFMRK
ncbi:hypothetical protein LSAT2_006106 [Lamellibrachia satsuma]|nr:hypothetical protein LSAT2_006106 [Lamellibrachia satsuma]